MVNIFGLFQKKSKDISRSESVPVSEQSLSVPKDELPESISEVTQREEQKTSDAKKLASELSTRVKEVESQYKATESTKTAMLNLLEDARELEATLKVERDRATAIISTMSEGLFVVDMNFRVILVNNMAANFIGSSVPEIIGKKFADISIIYKGAEKLKDEDRPLWKAMQSGKTVSVGLEDDYYLGNKSGKIPIAISAVSLKQDDKTVGGLVTFHDISRDKHVKEMIEATVVERTHQLQQEQARFTASIRTLELGYILTDPAGTIVNKNPAIDKMLGLTSSDLNIQNIDPSVEKQIQIIEMHKMVIKEGKTQNKKNILLGVKHLDMFAAPVYIDEKKTEFLGTVIVIQDVTEAKVLERSRDEFFSIASHELRTPLTAIRGNTSMILEYFVEDINKNPELKEMIDDIHQSSIRLINIVNDFLQTSRLEQGRLAFKNEAFDVAPLIEAALKEYEVTGSRKKLYLKYEPPEKPMPQVVGDKDRIKEVLINLVGNALKFTEVGGVTVKVYLSDDTVRVVIEDTGRGIPYEYQMLLFHKFQQAGDSLFTRDTTKGTGLGLYISKLLVEGMGGTIGLQYSQPGKGSAFGFALPIVGSVHAKEISKNPPVAPNA